MEDTETQNSIYSVFKNKGTGEGILRLLRAQQLVRRRMLVVVTLFEVFLAHSLHKTEK
jgi:hypothetical protein